MPYLTKIGPHVQNKSGLTAKGYHLYRRGSRVIREWGPILIMKGQKLSVYWLYKKANKIKCPSEKEASLQIKDRINLLIKKGYKKLTIGVKIWGPYKTKNNF